MREDKLELDVRILAKNLEITKLLTKIDNLTSELVNLQLKYEDLEVRNERLFNDHSIKIETDEN